MSNSAETEKLGYLKNLLPLAGLSMGMSFLWESHGKRPMGWDSTHLYFPWDSEIEWQRQNVTELSYLDYTSEFQSQ